MRVAAITPIRVSEEELTRRQARYDRLTPPPLRVQLRNLDDPDAADGYGSWSTAARPWSSGAAGPMA